MFAGLPELRVDGLGEPVARALLATAIAMPLDERVRDRIVAEARGNPRGLLELSRYGSRHRRRSRPAAQVDAAHPVQA
jgi:hypothetical protein